MIYRLLYNLLIHLGLPLALLALYNPKKGKPGFGRRWAEHLGRTPATGQEAPLWIQAVSVGETLAISPFIRALKAEQPSLPILLTTTTRTGPVPAAHLAHILHAQAPPIRRAELAHQMSAWRAQPHLYQVEHPTPSGAASRSRSAHPSADPSVVIKLHQPRCH